MEAVFFELHDAWRCVEAVISVLPDSGGCMRLFFGLHDAWRLHDSVISVLPDLWRLHRGRRF